jgi:hypothetical protein
MQKRNMIMGESTGGFSAFALLRSPLFSWVHCKHHLQTPISCYLARGMALVPDFPLRTFASFAFQDFLD